HGKALGSGLAVAVGIGIFLLAVIGGAAIVTAVTAAPDPQRADPPVDRFTVSLAVTTDDPRGQEIRLRWNDLESGLIRTQVATGDGSRSYGPYRAISGPVVLQVDNMNGRDTVHCSIRIGDQPIVTSDIPLGQVGICSARREAQ